MSGTNKNARSGEAFGLRQLVALAVLVFGSVIGSAQAPRTDLSGAWEGQMLLRGNWRFMEARFGTRETSPDTKVDLPQERREFRDFQLSGNQMQWALVRGASRIRFDGMRQGDVIRGEAEQNGVRGEFQLVRINRTQAGQVSGLLGTFRTDRGALVTIARFDFGDGIDRLALMDTGEGYWGTLLPTRAMNSCWRRPDRAGSPSTCASRSDEIRAVLQAS